MSEKLPFEPESIEQAAARYPAAVERVWDADQIVDAVEAGQDPDLPGLHRAHVFDLPYDRPEPGLLYRIILSVERSDRIGQTALHASASVSKRAPHVPEPMSREQYMLRFLPAASDLVDRITDRATNGGPCEVRLTMGGVMHLVYPWPLMRRMTPEGLELAKTMPRYPEPDGRRVAERILQLRHLGLYRAHFTADEWAALWAIGPLAGPETVDPNGEAWVLRHETAHFQTYRIEQRPDGPVRGAIRCRHCGMISHNIHDRLRGYCPQCKLFHEDWDYLASAVGAAALDADRHRAEGLGCLAEAIEHGDTQLHVEAARKRNSPIQEFRERAIREAANERFGRTSGGAAVVTKLTRESEARTELRDKFGGPCVPPQTGLMTLPDVPGGAVVDENFADIACLSGSIEALLQKHAQVLNVSPFAAGVAAAARTTEALR